MLEQKPGADTEGGGQVEVWGKCWGRGNGGRKGAKSAVCSLIPNSADTDKFFAVQGFNISYQLQNIFSQ